MIFGKKMLIQNYLANDALLRINRILHCDLKFCVYKRRKKESLTYQLDNGKYSKSNLLLSQILGDFQNLKFFLRNARVLNIFVLNILFTINYIAKIIYSFCIYNH